MILLHLLMMAAELKNGMANLRTMGNNGAQVTW